MSILIGRYHVKPDDDQPEADPGEPSPFATALEPDELAQMLTTSGDTLVLDCRSFLAYNHGHVVGAYNVTCPTLLLKRLNQKAKKRRPSQVGKKCHLLSQLVNAQEVRERCVSGHVYAVVLYGGRPESPDDEVLLESLLGLLGTDVPALYYLKDGYEAFADAYPNMCVAEENNAVQDLAPPPHTAALRHVKNYLAYGSTCYNTVPMESQENMALEPTEILPFLYLGNQRNSTDTKALEELRINYVLNVAKELENREPILAHGLRYKYLPMVDSTEQDLLQYFEEAFAFIDEARHTSGKVLVHCVGGISRSVAVILAYLMRSENMRLEDAYSFMKTKKANISPNISFMGQLVEFEKAEQERMRNHAEKQL